MQDKLLPVRDALARVIDYSPHSATIWRWSRMGVSTADGRVVRLRTLRIGRRLFSKISWVQEFLAALNQDDGEPSPERDSTLERALIASGLLVLGHTNKEGENRG